jgi:hypothetical protein
MLALTPEKPEPVPFPVEVTVNGVKVTVTLMLKPGTAATVEETKTTTERLGVDVPTTESKDQ